MEVLTFNASANKSSYVVVEEREKTVVRGICANITEERIGLNVRSLLDMQVSIKVFQKGLLQNKVYDLHCCWDLMVVDTTCRGLLPILLWTCQSSSKIPTRSKSSR